MEKRYYYSRYTKCIYTNSDTRLGKQSKYIIMKIKGILIDMLVILVSEVYSSYVVYEKI